MIVGIGVALVARTYTRRVILTLFIVCWLWWLPLERSETLSPVVRGYGTAANHARTLPVLSRNDSGATKWFEKICGGIGIFWRTGDGKIVPRGRFPCLSKRLLRFGVGHSFGWVWRLRSICEQWTACGNYRPERAQIDFLAMCLTGYVYVWNVYRNLDTVSSKIRLIAQKLTVRNIFFFSVIQRPFIRYLIRKTSLQKFWTKIKILSSPWLKPLLPRIMSYMMG